MRAIHLKSKGKEDALLSLFELVGLIVQIGNLILKFLQFGFDLANKKKRKH